MTDAKKTRVDLFITVLGRTLEHLGVQMYKRRDTAIAELVANCWDAGASRVKIMVPDPETYDMNTSTVLIEDDGGGMSIKQVQDEYLVVGRNRRESSNIGGKSRPVMGKKGIGKLAGFGIASDMALQTWQGDSGTEFVLNIDALKREDGNASEVKIEGFETSRPTNAKTQSGTRITLRHLKHKTPIDIEKLRNALSRRFSRVVRGSMEILVNGEAITDPPIELEYRIPKEGYETATVDGKEARFYYGFAKETIKTAELRGFTVYVRGKTAQAPPFYFHVEGTASGQHGTKYLTGAIEADFLDESTDDKADVISTDRQEIDWESDAVQKFLEWGAALTRKALTDYVDRKGNDMRDWLLKEPLIANRVARLDVSSKKQVATFLSILGKADAERERGLELADSIVKAFEYRHFHDVIKEIEDLSDNPGAFVEFVSRLKDWKVLESRAVLEIIKGRIDIVEKFHQMIVNDAPETKSKISSDNMHDLLAGSPWILNPEWQVLSEEKTISKQLREWGRKDTDNGEDATRFDFLALTDERRLVIIEIKRAGYAVEVEDLQRLERYKEKLSKAHDKAIYMVMLCGGDIKATGDYRKNWENRQDGEITEWNKIYTKNKNFYKHYRAVLEGDVENPEFQKKSFEVAQTRQIISVGTVHRPPEARKEGLGGQDVEYGFTNRIGVLAFGSLLTNLGSELQEMVDVDVVVDTTTPFPVEFAHGSNSRGGAPTLVPVSNGIGSKVNAKIFVLKTGISLEDATNALWRRETNQIGSGIKMPASRDIPIKVLKNYNSVGIVIYAAFEPDIKQLTADNLANLAIESVTKVKEVGRDGISYLLAAQELGIKTPLTDAYRDAILKITGTSDLATALSETQKKPGKGQ